MPSAILALALFGAYLALAPPVSGDKDASEFVLVLATGGVLHPTGYPLYTMLGHLFVQLMHALGAGFPRAANVWCAVGGGVAMFLYHRLALRIVPAHGGISRSQRIVLAALPVLMLGFDPVWVAECTVVEVHSWHLAWAFGTALYLFGLIEDLDARGASLPHLAPRMAAWGFLCGLGGAHHATAVFIAGGLTLALCGALARARRLHAWVPLLWLAAGALPFLSYVYVYRQAVHPSGGQVWPTLGPSWRSVIDHATARDYHAYLGHWAPNGPQAAWLRWYVYPYLWPGLVLFGIQTFRARPSVQRQVAVGLLLAAVAQAVFVYRYGIPDPDAYFLPGLAVALLALPTAGAGLLRASRRSRGRVAWIAAAATAGLIGFVVPCVTLAIGRRHALIEADQYLHAYWQRIPLEKGIVLWDADACYRLGEYQAFHGEKVGLDVYNTAALFNDAPRSRFERKYGFDPLGFLDPAHQRQPLKAEFVTGQHSEPDAHRFALVHECITLNAGVPVVAFDPPRPLRVWTATPDSALERASSGGHPAPPAR